MDYKDLSNSTLLNLCLQTTDADAWKEFYRRFHPVIFAFVMHWCQKLRINGYGEQHSEAMNDLVQDVFFKLVDNNCKALRVFQNRNDRSIYSYFKNIAKNTVINHHKSISSQKRRGKHVSLQAPVGNGRQEEDGFTLEDVLAGDMYDLEKQQEFYESCNAMLRILQRHWRGKQKDRDIRIFMMNLLCDLPPEEIAGHYSIDLSVKRVRNIITELKKVLGTHMDGKRSN